MLWSNDLHPVMPIFQWRNACLCYAR